MCHIGAKKTGTGTGTESGKYTEKVKHIKTIQLTKETRP